MTQTQVDCVSKRPSVEWITTYLWALICVAVVALLIVKLSSRARLISLLTGSGVAGKRVARSLREIERKVFHVAGLLIPLWYHLMTTRSYMSADACVAVAVSVSAFVWASELARLNFPWVQQAFMATFMGRIMRERETTQVTGTAYFTTGCALVIALFPEDIAITSMLYLVIGDMIAALIGVSFGGDACVVKLGREGKKSVEGSLAMFAVCFLIGCVTFYNLRLSEYVAFVSAAVATLTELWSEDHLNLNDNLTIPLFSSVALAWAMARVEVCTAV